MARQPNQRKQVICFAPTNETYETKSNLKSDHQINRKAS